MNRPGTAYLDSITAWEALSYCPLSLPELYCCPWIPLTSITQATHSQLFQDNKTQL